MKINQKIYYVQVPLNSEGLKELDYCDEELKNVQTFEFSVSEINFLMKLFLQFNEAFCLSIDEYEYERMPASVISEALVMMQSFETTSEKEEEQNSINRLNNALQLASKLNMPSDFDF